MGGVAGGREANSSAMVKKRLQVSAEECSVEDVRTYRTAVSADDGHLRVRTYTLE